MSATRPTLFATAPTVRAVVRARAVVLLVGGYDGSGNYGDIAQYEAALALLARLGPEILVLPLLERQYLASHRQLVAADAGPASPHAAFFDPDERCEDDLLPLAAPADLAFSACYLYGGGYLNHAWGERKLAMLAAAEALAASGGCAASCRVSSGLQAEPEWLAAGNASRLRGFDQLGARDGRSAQALGGLDPEAAVLASGDDAIGVLGRLPPGASGVRSEDRLRLNLHFAAHEWVSDDPGAALDFYASLAAELGRLASRPVLAQPLIAYLDERIDEHGAAAQLGTACAERGIEAAPPLVLRPAALGAVASRLGEASLTLSRSYHVALTSLMLGVPALLLADNSYYEQKAAGLREDFELPPELTATSGDDPLAVAARIAPLLAGGAAADLRLALAATAERQRQRRARIELDLLGRLGDAAVAALAGRIEVQAERLRLRSVEPAQLQARLSDLREERDQLRRRLEESPLEAELRVRVAEAEAAEARAEVTTILQSRSWRLLSPLRRLGVLLRRG
jgi:polysaccharide pyruvyl transferase WcaK-like protein